MFYSIHSRTSVSSKEYSDLKLKCYLCSSKKHIAIDCLKFKYIRGNLSMKARKLQGNKDKVKDDESELDKNIMFYR
jgi:hypothetical protein